MKTILFFDGVDGSGKSTCIKNLYASLRNLGIQSEIIGKNYPMDLEALWKVKFTKEKDYSAFKRLKFSLRITRLNLYLDRVKESQSDLFIFDRGLLHILIRAKMAGLKSSYFKPYIKELAKRLKPFKVGTLLMTPPLPVIFNRLGQRDYLAPHEEDTQFLRTYYNYGKKLLNKYEVLGKTQRINTAKYDEEESLHKILRFLGSKTIKEKTAFQINE